MLSPCHSLNFGKMTYGVSDGHDPCESWQIARGNPGQHEYVFGPGNQTRDTKRTLATPPSAKATSGRQGNLCCARRQSFREQCSFSPSVRGAVVQTIWSGHRSIWCHDRERSRPDNAGARPDGLLDIRTQPEVQPRKIGAPFGARRLLAACPCQGARWRDRPCPRMGRSGASTYGVEGDRGQGPPNRRDKGRSAGFAVSTLVGGSLESDCRQCSAVVAKAEGTLNRVHCYSRRSLYALIAGEAIQGCPNRLRLPVAAAM